jgi:hypothetical protein
MLTTYASLSEVIYVWFPWVVRLIFHLLKNGESQLESKMSVFKYPMLVLILKKQSSTHYFNILT